VARVRALVPLGNKMDRQGKIAENLAALRLASRTYAPRHLGAGTLKY
jgi:hypothetical protein